MIWLGIRDVLLIGAVECFLLFIVIMALSYNNKRANYLLAALTGLHGYRFLLWFLLISGAQFSWHIIPLLILTMATAPTLYFYVIKLTEPDYRFKRKDLLHLLPPLLVTAAAVSYGLYQHPELMTLPSQTIISILTNGIGGMLYKVIQLGYAIAALRALSRHQQLLRQGLSQLEQINLDWLRLLWSFVALSAIIFMATHLICVILGIDGYKFRLWAEVITIQFVVLCITLGGLRQPIIFTHKVKQALSDIDTPITAQSKQHKKAKYQRSGLNEEKLDILWDRVDQLFRQEMAYTNNELNLTNLAELAEVKPQELSQAINSKTGHSFYELVNGYRVEAAKALLEDPKQDGRKLLDIAMEVGFNSLSTFHRYFKSRYGQTPSQIRQQRTITAQTGS